MVSSRPDATGERHRWCLNVISPEATGSAFMQSPRTYAPGSEITLQRDETVKWRQGSKPPHGWMKPSSSYLGGAGSVLERRRIQESGKRLESPVPQRLQIVQARKGPRVAGLSNGPSECGLPQRTEWSW